MLANAMWVVGLPSWTVAGAPLHIRSFLFLSDQGPDEVHADTIIKEELAGMRNSVHLREWCFEHVAHLIAGANLHKHHDYWVALATFTNVFRSSGNPIRVKMEWERLHGKDDPAMAIIRRRLPPRPLRGRWSSAYETEKWLTDCGRWKNYRKYLCHLSSSPMPWLPLIASAFHLFLPSSERMLSYRK